MAERHNAAMREHFAQKQSDWGEQYVTATATAWPFDAASHAEEVAQFDYAAWGLEPPRTAPASQGDALDATRTAWLNADDMAALERLDETLQDGEGYDVPAAQMKRMAELGVVHHHSAGRYSITSFGRWVLGSRLLRRPLETIDECNARLGVEHRAALAAQKGGA